MPPARVRRTGRSASTNEHEDDEQKAVDVLIGRRNEGGAQAFDHTQQQAADERARDRAQTADDDDLKALDGGDGAVGRKHHEQRREQCTGKASQRHANGKGDRIEPIARRRRRSGRRRGSARSPAAPVQPRSLR